MGISEILATLQTSCGEIKNAPCIGVAQIALVPQKIRSVFSPEYIQNAVQGEVLTSLPSSITSIGNYAFHSCTNLALTSLPSGVTSIGTYVFHSCTNLALTSLPSGITSIGTYAFYGCTKLALTSLPSGITSIGTYAFRGCTGLTTLTFLGTPSGSIDSTAFTGCTNLLTINVPWASGAKAGAPWGATNATINYNYIP